MLNRKYYKLYFAFLMSFLISGAISLFFALKNYGIEDGFLVVWILGGWIYAFFIAFPLAYLLPKYVTLFLDKIVAKLDE